MPQKENEIIIIGIYKVYLKVESTISALKILYNLILCSLPKNSTFPAYTHIYPHRPY